MFGVGKQNLAKVPVEGMAKLHGFEWDEWQGVFVDAVESVIAYPPRSSFPLWHYARRAETKAGEVSGNAIRQDHPLTFVDHVEEFFVEEVLERSARRMWPSLNGLVQAALRPRLR